ncbi:hypothetical protein NMG60_11000942 [Bertholletia excelsa]
MALSAALRANLAASSCHQRYKLCSFCHCGKDKRLSLSTVSHRKSHPSWTVKSALDSSWSSVNDNGATEPARILLERLFDQTQKLEEMGKDSCCPQDAQLGLNLGLLESDLQAALAALKKKEEHLQDAENKVLLEHNELNRGKEELVRREEEIAAICSRHEKLEEELKLANHDLASQATQIEDLKFQIKQRDEEISAAQSSLALREDEIEKMKNELMKKSEEAVAAEFEYKSMAHLLHKANEVVKKQDIELQLLRKAIQDKEAELEFSVSLQECEREKLKVAEAGLEKKTTEWFLAQEELKRLEDEASKYKEEANKTLEDFRRVKKLLSDVRSELVLSQNALASSRQKVEDQELLLQKQLGEIEVQKQSVMSYTKSLEDAQIELESERAKLRVAEDRNKELERDLSLEKELVELLQEELDKERDSLQQAIEEKSSIQEELDQERTKFSETQNLLQGKESELVEARIEIHCLKSELTSFQLILEEKDLELVNARRKLEEVNEEIAELRNLLNSQEKQLIQATSTLKDKEENLQIIQHELNDTKLKYSEAETVVKRIVDLTNKLIISVKDEDYEGSETYNDVERELLDPLLKKSTDDFTWQKKQLESALEFTRESLRSKEKEVLSAQRALTVRDEELKKVLERLDAKERELKKVKEEMVQDANDVRNLYAIAQERIGGRTISDLAIEKLQLEAAQLEVEAAIGALHKLAEMSQELLGKACLSLDADSNTEVLLLNNGSDPSLGVVNNMQFGEFKTEVARLSALTDQLVKEAGIVIDVNK